MIPSGCCAAKLRLSGEPHFKLLDGWCAKHLSPLFKFPLSKFLDPWTPGIPEEPSNKSSLSRRSPFLDRPSYLQTFSVRASERWKEKPTVVYSKGATAALHTRVSCRNVSARTLHLGACPHLTCIPHHSRQSLCCSARTLREFNFKLLTAGALTISTAVHVSMMYLATPATLTTTHNPHRSSLLVFVIYVATLPLDHLYSPFLGRQKHTQPGIRATERKMHARLTQQGVVGLHARVTRSHLSSFLDVCAFVPAAGYCVGRSRVSNGESWSTLVCRY